jgi:transcriptional regulator with XRE-family HTH domain
MDQIESARRALGLSQHQLAVLSRTSQPTISRLENGIPTSGESFVREALTRLGAQLSQASPSGPLPRLRGAAPFRGRKATQAEKHRAQRKAREATLRCRPKACSACGRPSRVHAHHEDYSRPLDVVFLCALCHRRRHAGKLDLPSPPGPVAVSIVNACSAWLRAGGSMEDVARMMAEGVRFACAAEPSEAAS